MYFTILLLTGGQFSPGGAVVSTAPTNLKAPATLLVQLRQLHPLTAPPGLEN